MKNNRLNFTEKQTKILTIAEELIEEKGFEKTSIRDICAKANINVAMISYYFGSKDKMLAYLYQYRIQRAREQFSELAQILNNGQPEIQMREIIKFIISQIFKYHYFHNFVREAVKPTNTLEGELYLFYQKVIERINEIVEKGIILGVFHNIPKAEDLFVNIVAPSVFIIRNDYFYKKYLHNSEEALYLPQAEERMLTNAYQTVFSLLGYRKEF